MDRGPLGLAALICTAFIAAGCNGGAAVQAAKATRKPLLVPILADGSLEPPTGGEIRATEGGSVGEILVHEGQRVARGTPLLRLTNPELDQRVFASRSELLQITQEAQRNAAELEMLRQERDRLRATVEADQRLLAAGAITAQQRAADDFSDRQAADRARQAESNLAQLERRKQIIGDSARQLERRLALLTIAAPIDGIIYNLPRLAGENVVPGQQLGTVADPRYLRVRIRVDAPDLPRIHAGQPLIVTFDGLPNRRWLGTILLVPPGLRLVGGREVAEVIGELSDDTAALPANASVNVQVVVGEKPSALVIPRGALLREGEKRFVYQYVDGKAHRTDVGVGLIGPTEVEVISGLREGDQVILPGSVPLHDGDAVHITEAS